MDYILVAFRSRSQAIGFSELLDKRGVENKVVNTPKEAKAGCGLSVATLKNKYREVKKALGNLPVYYSYALFSVSVEYGRKIVNRI